MFLKCAVEGNPEGQTLVFIHGWPDDAGLWDALIPRFLSTYRCVRITLPGFSGEDEIDPKLDFSELADDIIQQLANLKEERPNEKVTLIGHDWGAYLAYLIESRIPDQVRAIVGLDVGAHLVPSGPLHASFLVSYQAWLISAWSLRKSAPKLAEKMTQAFASMAKAPRMQQVQPRMNYVYFYFWRTLLNPKYRAGLLKKTCPSCPVLYLYGKDKPFHFHSESWLKKVNAKPRSEVHAVSGGHWFLVTAPDETGSRIEEWLRKNGISDRVSP